jgi:Tol biopolymer transport system component
MSVSAGRQLGGYQILAPLGAGAMGEVWRARDDKLGREVAIKVLPEQFTSDAERLRRFEREAKTLASLNHPNVAQIFGVDQVGETCFLVLELVEGESLDERLKRGPLPLDEALDVCRQIAEGLEAAHEAGVIHRDLKPANVRLTPDGRVKLLDFGLAKPAAQGRDAPASTDSVLSTEAGRLLGTPTYMAPEQARGRPIDKRVDVWAFGCVLYECLTARRAFTGETLTDVLGSVLHTQPDPAALPSRTPAAVRGLLTRCLEKDPRQRLRDIGEARLLLDRALSQGPEEAPSAPRPSARRAWLVALLWAASLGVAIVATVLALGHTEPARAPVVRTQINLPADLIITNLDGSLALSPDGRILVFCAGRDVDHIQLWLRPLDSLIPQPLSGTDGATYPFWSPDGRSIGFFAAGKLKRIPADGGSVTTLCAAVDSRGGTWTSRDEIVFTPAPLAGLFRVPAAGGVPEPITKAEGRVSHRLPHALPGGQRVLFCQGNSDQDGIRLLDLDSGVITPISDDQSDAQYVAPGELLFVRAGNLMGQAFDLASGRLTGQPRLVAERVQFDEGHLSGRYCASLEGTLVYQATPETRLEWFDLDGRSLGRIGIPAAYQTVLVSPDGQRIMAYVSRSAGGSEIWLIDGQSGFGVAQPELQGITGFTWSPDGRSYAYALEDPTVSAPGLDPTSTWCATLDAPGQPRRIGSGSPTDWSRDGRWIGVMRLMPGSGLDVGIIPADGSGESQMIAATAASEVGGLFSPDSRWVGFGSDQSGQYQMYLAPVGRPGPVRPVTSFGSASVPTWLDDGRLVFVATTGELYELPFTPRGDELDVGERRLLFGGRKVPSATLGNVSVTRDGKRLLAIVPETGVGEPPFIVVQHGLEGGGR